jgi:hypothetical protein
LGGRRNDVSDKANKGMMKKTGRESVGVEREQAGATN